MALTISLTLEAKQTLVRVQLLRKKATVDNVAPDTQFAYGLTHPIPAVFFSTAGRPPFLPSAGTPQNTNEPYLDVRHRLFNEQMDVKTDTQTSG